MPEIFSWIDDAARSGRAVDYQDHYAAVTRLRMERDEARMCLREAMYGDARPLDESFDKHSWVDRDVWARWRKAAGMDAPTNRNIEKGRA